MRLVNEALLRVLTGWHELQARLSDEEGQTLAEYGLIMAVIAVAVVVGAVIAFRDQIQGAFDGASNCLDGSC
jgi:Flp pilus assembly pilin Flp